MNPSIRNAFIFSASIIVNSCAAILQFPLSASAAAGPESGKTATPVKHLVVIFQENVSFDHYFATYPKAVNKAGEPAFTALENTPSVNGLTEGLISHNPNSAAPFRLDRDHAATCDQNHHYTAEQKAADGGLMDKYVEFGGSKRFGCDPRGVMAYFDGNVVTALWNYAQHFAMSDNSYGTTFGPSTLGAVNLVAGQTHGAIPENSGDEDESFVADGAAVGDGDPDFDDCSGKHKFHLTGKNIGDALNRTSITWGWFEAGFKPTGKSASGEAVCGAEHRDSLKRMRKDYIPHHEPFQYYKSTSNPHHLPPTSLKMIGKTDQANHQYDMSDFWDAAGAGNVPEVSFLKAPAYQDGHAGYSDPLNEQVFLVETINRLQRSSSWKDMAIIIAYDDSDGWYDHVMPPIINQSGNSKVDSNCGTTKPGAYAGRCGYGPRLPLLVVSPFARTNFVDHTVTDQTSILRFIEDNWGLERIGDQSFDEIAGPMLQFFDFTRKEPAAELILNPETGR